MSDDRPACQDEACAIQTCLSRTSYNEQKCQYAIDALYRCCASFYDRANAGKYENLGGIRREGVKKSTACPLESVVRRTVKRMDKEAGESNEIKKA
ncbi:hypothetical protein FFLO_01273 [Filobasidium floriforme]|uniref:Cx9C motif-containing protein 4, mitochondrial n=1 Tax=Filobasidium floriforme TaxID=5210 RepID=A0A8K0NT05_9TREE|nr:hypothetical protein FFLO_01273 [Filobasidium floriforme]